jgi:hypothetical protein
VEVEATMDDRDPSTCHINRQALVSGRGDALIAKAAVSVRHERPGLMMPQSIASPLGASVLFGIAVFGTGASDRPVDWHQHLLVRDWWAQLRWLTLIIGPLDRSHVPFQRPVSVEHAATGSNVNPRPSSSPKYPRSTKS